MVRLRDAAPHNPALRQELLSQRPPIIAPREKESIFEWIESTGRFESYDLHDSHNDVVTDELEEIIGAPIYELDKEDEWDTAEEEE